MASLQAISLKPESVVIVPAGFNSSSLLVSFNLRSHNSNFVSEENESSNAPVRVPVAINGAPEPLDQAKTAVRSILRKRPIVVAVTQQNWNERSRGRHRKSEHEGVTGRSS